MALTPSPQGFWNLAGPDLIVLAMIMLVCGLPYVVVIGFMAARKGKSVPIMFHSYWEGRSSCLVRVPSQTPLSAPT